MIVVEKRGMGALYVVIAPSIYHGLTDLERDKSENNRVIRF